MARWTFPLLLFLVWVTADSDSLNTVSRNWCYAEEELPHTLRCNHGHVLSVLRAVPSVYGGSDWRFCQAPAAGPADCLLEEDSAQQTDHYRRMCNGRPSCVFLLANRPRNSCGSRGRGIMYLHLEYICLPVMDEEAKEYPLLHPTHHHTTTAEGSTIRLQSADYPSLWENITQTSCTLRTEPNTTLTVAIRDLSFKARDPTDSCLYFISVGNDTKVCAERGLSHRAIDVNQTVTEDGFVTTSLGFVMSDSLRTGVLGRFWIEIFGYDTTLSQASPVTITCMNPLVPPTAAAATQGDSRPLLALLVIPVIIIIVVVIIVVILLIRRQKKKKRDKESEPEADPEPKPEPEEHDKLTTGNHAPVDGDTEREPTEDMNLNHDKDREHTDTAS